ncbi:MAG: ATP-binding protein [Pseudomonadota bacterium]|nr:ATP-binding protein [Pseudomonadota bacterium]
MSVTPPLKKTLWSMNRLPTNPLLASMVIVFWLVFTPSAWRRYINQIDPELSPDFALTELKAHHWQQPLLQRLLLLGHGLWSLWVSIIVCCLLWFAYLPSEHIILASIYALLLSLVGGFLSSLFISVAFGITVGIMGGVLLSLPVGISGEVIFSMAENIAITVLISVSEAPIQMPNGDHYALITVLLAIFTASQASSITYTTTKTVYHQPHHRQIGSIVIGVFISGFVIFLLVELTSMLAQGAARLMESGRLFSLVYDGLISTIFGLLSAFIWIGHTYRWQQGLLLGVALSSFLGLFTFVLNQFYTDPQWVPIVSGLHGGIENAMLYVLLFAFPYGLAKRIANPWSGLIAGIFGSAGAYITFTTIMENYALQMILPVTLLVFILGFSIVWWRPLLLYPLLAAWNVLLAHADEKRLGAQYSLLGWHSALWDEHQYLPLFGLETYLVMIAERNPLEGRKALEYLSNTAQNWAAQEAQIELDARRLQSCTEVKAIANSHRQLAIGELSSSIGPLLRSLSRISRDVEAALAQESSYNQRLALDAVEERLDGLLRELTRAPQPYSARFYPIAAQWRQILADHVQALGAAVESRQEIVNPYIIGIPLTEHQEIFVGRSDISEHIEKLLLDFRCPPLLLYGQRRTGKTSLLNNLGKLLPWSIIPLFVDLQGPASLAKDYQGFLYNISRAMNTSAKRHRERALPALTRDSLSADPFTRFDEWLDEIEQQLEENQTILLTLDEFSALEHIFNKGLLDEALVLGMFRHIIQHRPRFKILLSGSHTLDEFERWASYLINVQIVHISYLQTKEAVQLIEQPVKNFALHYQPEARQRVIEITRGHPALIQLLCAEIVTLKNKQPIQTRRLAAVNDVEQAIAGALQHGRFFFADIANNQVSATGLQLLTWLAQQGEQVIVSRENLLIHFPYDFEDNLAQLLQRELIEAVDEGYRFQVELIRRWFVTK